MNDPTPIAEAVADLDLLSAYVERLAGIIERHGWAVQAVGGDGEGEHPFGFSYTVGLAAKGLPELWIDTLAPEQAAGILNGLAELAVKRGGLPVGEDIDIDYSIPFRLRGPVDVDEAQAFVARRMLPEGGELGLLQVLWADAAGAFPDDASYDQARFPQRLLPLAEPDDDGAPCCPDPGCPGRGGGECTFPGYADNH